MLADDIQAAAVFEYKAHCTTCNGANSERVSIPNSVIMDALAAPVDGLDGGTLADVVLRDSRITARTALNPVPHRPSSRFGRQHLMQRAVDMVNARLIPFSPFGGFVNADGLRNRPIYTEWHDRYLSDLPDTSTLAGTTVLAPAETDAAVTASTADLEAGTTEPEPDGESVPADDKAPTVIEWIGGSPDRARRALQWETDRSRARKSVVEHAETVLGLR